ncbi:MAG: PQQ-binding-like beta-propeller repeat protein [Planctomycetota bacterium]|nr:PQQ-binding-like beta-propeller repeat protein [Planctomycetota bacterium]
MIGTNGKAWWMAVCVAAVAALGAQAADWPNWRGPAHNGVSEEKGWSAAWPKEGPKVLWKAQVGIGFSSFAVSGNRVVTLGNRDNQDTIYCFDAATGEEKWKHAYPCGLDPNMYEGGPNATPAIEGGFVYSLSRDGELFCLELERGKVAWSTKVMQETGAERPMWGFTGSPIVVGDVVVVNVGETGTGVKKADGKIAWKSGTAKAGYGSAVPFMLGKEQAVALFVGKALVILDPATGKEKARQAWITDWEVNASDPIILGDKFLVASGYGTGAALLQFNGQAFTSLWKNKEFLSQMSGGVAYQGCVYGFHGNNHAPPKELRCLDVATGQVKWKQGGKGLGALMLADGKLIVLTESGTLEIAPASPAAYEPAASAKVLDGRCWTPPVLANGRLFVRNAAGDVRCLDLSGK